MSLPEPYLPPHMVDGIKLYVEHGIEPGSFMYAVLTNDLRGAIGRADHINQNHIADIVSWLTSEVPSACWGSPERVRNWIKLHEDRRAGENNEPTN